MMGEANAEDVAFVNSSSYRTRVLRDLSESPDQPSDIAQQTGISIAHVSRAIREMVERDLVELIVPEDTHKGRVYDTTEDGERVIDALDRMDV